MYGQVCLRSAQCGSKTYSTSDDDGLAGAAELRALGRDGRVGIVMPGRHWGGEWWLHGCTLIVEA
jgi:hypothetical protein